MSEVKRSLPEYIKGSRIFATLMRRDAKGLRNYVPSYVAHKRAEVCLQCPFNQPSRGFVRFTDAVILQLTGARKTSYDKVLKNCDACSCPLKLMVHLTDDVLRQTKDSKKLLERITKRQRETRKKINPNCWQTKSLNIENP